jgi:hypothetical protein
MDATPEKTERHPRGMKEAGPAIEKKKPGAVPFSRLKNVAGALG